MRPVGGNGRSPRKLKVVSTSEVEKMDSLDSLQDGLVVKKNARAVTLSVDAEVSLVGRTIFMTISQLTHLHISIPASGSPPGGVPEECFPSVPLPWVSADSRRVSFARAITVLGAARYSRGGRYLR